MRKEIVEISGQRDNQGNKTLNLKQINPTLFTQTQNSFQNAQIFITKFLGILYSSINILVAVFLASPCTCTSYKSLAPVMAAV